MAENNEYTRVTSDMVAHLSRQCSKIAYLWKELAHAMFSRGIAMSLIVENKHSSCQLALIKVLHKAVRMGITANDGKFRRLQLGDIQKAIDKVDSNSGVMLFD